MGAGQRLRHVLSALGPLDRHRHRPGRLAIECEVNEQIRQDGNTADMVRSIPELVAWISSVMTLVPGDVILTGTPAGWGRCATETP